MCLGRSVHARIVKTLHWPPPLFLANHLINMYSKLGLRCLTPSRKVVSWKSLVSGIGKLLELLLNGLLLNLGEQLHGLVFLSGLNRDVSVCNGLIDFYGKCKKIHRGETVFAEMGTRNTVSWCSLVAVYVQNHEDEKVFVVSTPELGRSVHAHAVKACLERTIFVGSALVDMYGKCGCIEDSEQAFDEMPEKNLVTKNSLISGYAHQGQVDMAVGII
ncbi:hypothetical protein Bca101_043213 [Brassica carinata]